MLVCGIELTATDAVICLLNHNGNTFNLPECRQRMFSLPKAAATDAMREFHFAFKKLMEDYQVDVVVIIERPQKGKLAGTAISFKLETAIQLISLPVIMINHTTMKEQLKLNKMQAEFDSLGLKKFQQPALNAAYAYLTEYHSSYKKD